MSIIIFIYIYIYIILYIDIYSYKHQKYQKTVGILGCHCSNNPQILPYLQTCGHEIASAVWGPTTYGRRASAVQVVSSKVDPGKSPLVNQLGHGMTWKT